MADVLLRIANPTAAAVTVNSQTVPARQSKDLTIADDGTDAYGFLAAGCAVISVDAETSLSKRVEAAFRLTMQQHLG